MEHYAGNLTSPEFAERIKECKAIFVVIGSCEQHGHHMPLDTDNIIGLHTALVIAEKTKSLVLPPVNYGQVWSARKFSGTIALSTETLKNIIHDIVVSLEMHGAKYIILWSGHNGNLTTMREAARELLDKYNWHNVWYMLPEMKGDLIKNLLETPMPGGVAHAGELETSMLLAIRPDLVRMDKATHEVPEISKHISYRPISWDEFIQTGAFGAADLGSVEKGNAIMQAIIDDSVRVINSLIPD